MQIHQPLGHSPQLVLGSQFSCRDEFSDGLSIERRKACLEDTRVALLVGAWQNIHEPKGPDQHNKTL